MDFQNYLQESAEKIANRMDIFFNQWKKEVEKVDLSLIHLVDAVIEANKGGKKLRGCLVKLGYELFSGEANDDIYNCSASHEIFQTALLSHDDIIDKSQLRRGKPTLFSSLGGDHYAISQTICLGDIGFFLSIKIISDTNFPPERKIKAISHFTHSMVETTLGEILDVEIPNKKIDPVEEQIMNIYKYKTARYTLVGPLQMGAVLAGGDEKSLEKIKQFGDYLGIAFQIQDDILGIFGTQQDLGKPVTSDVEEGKATILLTYARQNGTKEQLKILDQFYGKGQIDTEDFEKVKQIFLQTKSLDQAQVKAVQYVTEAKKIIPGITQNTNHQKLLEQLADFLIERKK